MRTATVMHLTFGTPVGRLDQKKQARSENNCLECGAGKVRVEKEIRDVAVQIVRFLDPHNPGVVECKLVDAEGFAHTFVDKVPIFTTEMLDAQSAYPQPGSIRCRIMSRSEDSGGRPLVRIS